MTAISEEPFEAVFYSEPVPSSLRTLAVLALVFDRIHFPGVHIAENADPEATAAEVERISRLPIRRGIGDTQLLNCMIYAIHRRDVSDFCYFTGLHGSLGVLESGTSDLVREFEEAIYGPPPENFYPTYNLGFAKGLPGAPDAAVNGPSWLSYPPNAVLYAAKKGVVLVNDNPSLPVFGLPVEGKANARVLSTHLALEAVQLALPALPDLSFAGIAEFRRETRNEVRPFRRAMLRMSKELNAAILADASAKDIQREARFLVETTIMPELAELREQISKPHRPWHRRAIDAAKTIPEIVGNYSTLPPSLATAKLLAALGSLLADARDDQLATAAKRGGFNYLLRIQESGRK